MATYSPTITIWVGDYALHRIIYGALHNHTVNSLEYLSNKHHNTPINTATVGVGGSNDSANYTSLRQQKYYQQQQLKNYHKLTQTNQKNNQIRTLTTPLQPHLLTIYNPLRIDLHIIPEKHKVNNWIKFVTMGIDESPPPSPRSKDSQSPLLSLPQDSKGDNIPISLSQTTKDAFKTSNINSNDSICPLSQSPNPNTATKTPPNKGIKASTQYSTARSGVSDNTALKSFSKLPDITLRPGYINSSHYPLQTTTIDQNVTVALLRNGGPLLTTSLKGVLPPNLIILRNQLDLMIKADLDTFRYTVNSNPSLKSLRLPTTSSHLFINTMISSYNNTNVGKSGRGAGRSDRTHKNKDTTTWNKNNSITSNDMNNTKNPTFPCCQGDSNMQDFACCEGEEQDFACCKEGNNFALLGTSNTTQIATIQPCRDTMCTSGCNDAHDNNNNNNNDNNNNNNNNHDGKNNNFDNNNTGHNDKSWNDNNVKVNSTLITSPDNNYPATIPDDSIYTANYDTVTISHHHSCLLFNHFDIPFTPLHQIIPEPSSHHGDIADGKKCHNHPKQSNASLSSSFPSSLRTSSLNLGKITPVLRDSVFILTPIHSSVELAGFDIKMHHLRSFITNQHYQALIRPACRWTISLPSLVEMDRIVARHFNGVNHGNWVDCGEERRKKKGRKKIRDVANVNLVINESIYRVTDINNNDTIATTFNNNLTLLPSTSIIQRVGTDIEASISCDNDLVNDEKEDDKHNDDKNVGHNNTNNMKILDPSCLKGHQKTTNQLHNIPVTHNINLNDGQNQTHNDKIDDENSPRNDRTDDANSTEDDKVNSEQVAVQSENVDKINGDIDDIDGYSDLNHPLTSFDMTLMFSHLDDIDCCSDCDSCGSGTNEEDDDNDINDEDDADEESYHQAKTMYVEGTTTTQDAQDGYVYIDSTKGGSPTMGALGGTVALAKDSNDNQQILQDEKNQQNHELFDQNTATPKQFIPLTRSISQCCCNQDLIRFLKQFLLSNTYQVFAIDVSNDDHVNYIMTLFNRIIIPLVDAVIEYNDLKYAVPAKGNQRGNSNGSFNQEYKNINNNKNTNSRVSSLHLSSSSTSRTNLNNTNNNNINTRDVNKNNVVHIRSSGTSTTPIRTRIVLDPDNLTQNNVEHYYMVQLVLELLVNRNSNVNSNNNNNNNENNNSKNANAPTTHNHGYNNLDQHSPMQTSNGKKDAKDKSNDQSSINTTWLFPLLFHDNRFCFYFLLYNNHSTDQCNGIDECNNNTPNTLKIQELIKTLSTRYPTLPLFQHSLPQHPIEQYVSLQRLFSKIITQSSIMMFDYHTVLSKDQFYNEQGCVESTASGGGESSSSSSSCSIM